MCRMYGYYLLLSVGRRLKTKSLIHRLMISNRKPRVKSDLFEALAELSDFRGLNIRNLSGYTTTFTKLFPLSKKACCKQASLSALRSRSRRGCSRDGF